MVGVPRSRGCGVCVKRRIKCDESRPGCGNCTRYGAECPGYGKGFKFVVGKPHRSKRQQNKSSKSCDTSSFSSTSPSDTSRKSSYGSGSTSPSSEEGQIESRMLLASKIIDRATTPDRLQLPNIYFTQALALLLEHLRPSMQSAAGHMTFTSWLAVLPSRPIVSNGLDAALRCFVAHQLGRIINDRQMMHYSQVEYVRALSLLQRALRSPTAWSSSETLCSAILLGVHELFAGTTSYDSWMKHASGIGKLIQARGPQLHRTEFDNLLLRSFRATIIMDALFSGKDCFLAEDEWRRVARERFDGKTSDELYNLFEDFSFYLSQCPTIVRRGLVLRDASMKGLMPDLADAADLYKKTLQLHQDFQAWFAAFTRIVGAPTETVSYRADPLYPVIYEYPDMSIGTAYTGYWACRLIVHKILMACQHPEDFEVLNEELADNICKSVEHVGSDNYGPYRLGFALRIAYEVNNLSRRMWIMNVLEGFSKIYAATNPDSYPSLDEA